MDCFPNNLGVSGKARKQGTGESRRGEGTGKGREQERGGNRGGERAGEGGEQGRGGREPPNVSHLPTTSGLLC